MWRWFALTVIGLFALYGAWQLHPERTGWLFQQFGQQGIAVGMLLMAIVFTLIGVVGMLRWARRLSGLVASRKDREGAVKEARVFAAPRAAVQRNPHMRGRSFNQWNFDRSTVGFPTLSAIPGPGLRHRSTRRQRSLARSMPQAAQR
jgi:hypothetical protein